MEGKAPAEPDDPNSSTLNPNKHEKLGVGKLAGWWAISLDTPLPFFV
ncbi:MAG TPA: hypothetical protein VEL68_18775 [Thermodesulfobacteriota bacterium]|nr:hypothetical protein [Thermodesulfobacteriota bacterium]